jgi:hypothetical protein
MYGTHRDWSFFRSKPKEAKVDPRPKNEPRTEADKTITEAGAKRRVAASITPQSVANLSPEQYAAAKRTLINDAEKKRRDEDQARLLASISQKFSKGK